jgi:hypothetical protein
VFWTCYSGVVLSGVVFSTDGTTFVFSGIDVLFCVSVLFLIFSLIWLIIALGVGVGVGFVVGAGYVGYFVCCAFYRYSCSMFCYFWLIVSCGVWVVGGIFVVVVCVFRAFKCSRALISSICLSKMACSLSIVSGVGISVLFSISVFEVFSAWNVVEKISFPFLDGLIGWVGILLFFPLDDGLSSSIVISWSSSVMISKSVRSIRFVVVVGAIVVWFGFCCGGCIVFCPFWFSNNVAMSFYIYSTAATVLVVFVVDAEVSSYSMYLMLFLRFSSL